MHRTTFSSRYLFGFILIGVVALNMPAWGQTVNEDRKLLPDDSAAGFNFGRSIAINNGIIAVGSYLATNNGVPTGAVYLFSASTGSQLRKLVADDGASSDYFGWSVAMDDGKVVVGAYQDDDNGSNSGSVYVFDASTGNQLIKIVSSDGGADDRFGFSVGISDNIVVAGAYQAEDFDAGSAYLFDATTGTQLFELLPTDAAPFDSFGYAVAIENGVVAVGAYRNDGNGSDSGATYIFDADTGAQVHKLVPADLDFGYNFGFSLAIDQGILAASAPWGNDNKGAVYLFNAATAVQIHKLVSNDGNELDWFGYSVDIQDGFVVVGADKDDDLGSSSGSAYLFDASTGGLISKFLPSDGAANDAFGKSVATSAGVVGVGAYRDDDNGSASGSAYQFNVAGATDTDGDGLLDDWETNGIPYTDINDIERRFLLPGADPNHKDLYVEVDAMTGFAMSNEADLQLALAFEASPLDNPDGSNGITLHILRDETTLPHVPVWEIDGCWPMDFDNFRTNSFGTFNERTNVNHTTLLAAKAKAYRYCIIADQADDPSTPEFDNIGGCGGIPGDSFVIFIGTGNGGMYSTDGQAAVFMHELGHNLGLHHGGGDSINGKPNYPSIMNYLLTYKSSWSEDFWSLDYSRSDAANLATLNESSLNENVGVGSEDNFYSDYFMPFGVNYDNNGTTVRVIQYIALDGSTADFGDTKGTMFQDDEHDSSVVQDLNYAVNPPPGVNLPGVESPGQTLNPHNDWAKITLELLATGTSRQVTVFPTDELTLEAVDWMDKNFPAPPSPCPADLTGDGELNFFDVSAFLSAFSAGDLSADFTGDGEFNFFDVSAFLTAFSAGCP